MGVLTLLVGGWLVSLTSPPKPYLTLTALGGCANPLGGWVAQTTRLTEVTDDVIAADMVLSRHKCSGDEVAHCTRESGYASSGTFRHHSHPRRPPDCHDLAFDARRTMASNMSQIVGDGRMSHGPELSSAQSAPHGRYTTSPQLTFCHTSDQ